MVEFAQTQVQQFPEVTPTAARVPGSVGDISQVGRAAQQAGSDALDAGIKILDFHTQVAASDAYNKMQQALLDLGYGDGKGNPGFYGLHGQDALNAFPELRSQIESTYQGLLSSLPNGRAQLDFSSNSRRLISNFLEGAGRAYQSELTTFAGNTNTAQVKAAINSAGLNNNDDRAFEISVHDIVDADTKLGQLQGWSDVQLKDKIQTDTDTAVTERIRGLASNDPQAAYNLMQSHWDQLLPSPAKDALRSDVVKKLTDYEITNRYLIGLPSQQAPANFVRGSANAASAGSLWGTPGSADFESQHLTSIQSPTGQNITVNKVSAAAFNGFLKDLAATGYKIDDVEGYNDRSKLAGGPSQHAFGNAIDINPGRNPASGGAYSPGTGTLTTDLPSNIADIAAKWGITWGGDWHSLKDPMHFEYAGGGNAGDPALASTGGTPQPTGGTIPTTAQIDKDALEIFPSDPVAQKDYISAGHSFVIQQTYSNSIARADFSAKFNNAITNAESGSPGVPDEDPSILKAALPSLYPPDVAAQMSAELDLAQHVGKVYTDSIKWGSPSDVNAALNDLGTHVGPLSDSFKVRSGQGAVGTATDPTIIAKFQDAAFAKVATAVNDRNVKLFGSATGSDSTKADPASFTADNPLVIAALNGDDPTNPKDPSAFSNYANAQLTLQQHLGVPIQLQHILSRAEATSMKDALVNAPPGQTVQLLNRMQQQYGNQWPKVFQDLASIGGLPSTYQAITTLDPANATLLARGLDETKPKADGTPAASWDKVLGTDTGGTTSSSVAAGVSSFIRTQETGANQPLGQLVHSLTLTGFKQPQIDDLYTAVETLAYAKILYNRESPSQAQTEAVDAFTKNYEFLNGTARIPSNVFGPTQQAVGQAMTNLSLDQISVPQQIEQTLPEAYLSLLKASPTYVTSPNEDAIRIIDPWGFAVKNKDGSIFEIPFAKPGAVVQNTPQPAFGQLQVPVSPANQTSSGIVGGTNSVGIVPAPKPEAAPTGGAAAAGALSDAIKPTEPQSIFHSPSAIDNLRLAGVPQETLAGPFGEAFKNITRKPDESDLSFLERVNTAFKVYMADPKTTSPDKATIDAMTKLFDQLQILRAAQK